MKRGLLIFCSCFMLMNATQAQVPMIEKWARQHLLPEKPLDQANVGVCIYEPATDKYWYQYQDNKYFTPASNMKIFSLFAGLERLGDSLPALRYFENDTALFVRGTGDPSFLHPAFSFQPALKFLQDSKKPIYLVPAINLNKRYGPGWAWGDYADSYQPELNEWPMYGNVARISLNREGSKIAPQIFNLDVSTDRSLKENIATRDERNNFFYLQYNPAITSAFSADVPFITGGIQELRERLEDTLHKVIGLASLPKGTNWRMLRSIPVDSLFIPMMEQSDNFFAEQVLMMASALNGDTISSNKIIDQLLNTTLKGLPDTPQWADGSGLSRYNLFTPRDFVKVLTLMQQEYPKARLWNIFPTGGKGTLKNYYQQQFVHAKTGTLNGVVALSGYLVTQKGKTLVFSVMVNNHRGSASTIRRSIEQLLTMIYKQY
ncbi:D-alanyl-D-alanine carboxypeptidase/D-alanyl-D-alanine-endopeptidase [Chitinophaga silvatica]|uniref:D-alanyl-D-alanine carboxypeptidase/D-alanyl-D-alanine-endopeptidase n=1 Tax=Chitinophaga silvatica TaxID=2282649 RepID=A0A3E1YBE8_9BACT|nr:D-alanyl-D-alanine carboxypeptidase [Chitinophaga silvatica]RFS23345.1 D-alanyl-D-alanine carboxypeptidase/D-alanyl-D-alanine-endopeptidase [Chitinophaga silvatica]